MIVAAMLLLQVAPGTPQSFSVLADPCPPSSEGEVVVCGRAPERLPLPVERTPPDYAMPSNPDATPLGALAGSPCAAVQRGCQTGFNIFGPAVAAVRLVQKAVAPDSCCEGDQATNPFRLVGDAVKGVKRLGAKGPDKSGRVAIDLDTPPPVLAGRLSR